MILGSSRLRSPPMRLEPTFTVASSDRWIVRSLSIRMSCIRTGPAARVRWIRIRCVDLASRKSTPCSSSLRSSQRSWSICAPLKSTKILKRAPTMWTPLRVSVCRYLSASRIVSMNADVRTRLSGSPSGRLGSRSPPYSGAALKSAVWPMQTRLHTNAS